VQARPLSEIEAGLSFTVPELPVNPNSALPPAGSTRFQPASAADTSAPAWVTCAFHACVTFWPLANVHVTVHPFTGAVPVFPTFTPAWNPPCQWLVTV
jgi:hypothetical protein